jgi:hypothetical protein
VSGTEQQRRGVWRGLSLKQLRWVFVVAILGATAAFGGLQTADYKTPLSLGQTYDDGPLRITTHSVSLARQAAALPRLSPACRYLVLVATIENVAKDSVVFPLAHAVIGAPDDCAPRTQVTVPQLFGIVGVSAVFIGAFRGHEQMSSPGIEPGFTNIYRLVWVLPEAELQPHPQIAIRFHQMYQSISTFRIDRVWFSHDDRYGELRVTDSDRR